MLTLWFRDREFLNTGAPRDPCRSGGGDLHSTGSSNGSILHYLLLRRPGISYGRVRCVAYVRAMFLSVTPCLSDGYMDRYARALCVRWSPYWRTLEHNMKPMERREGWFEWIARILPCLSGAPEARCQARSLRHESAARF